MAMGSGILQSDRSAGRARVGGGFNRFGDTTNAQAYGVGQTAGTGSKNHPALMPERPLEVVHLLRQGRAFGVP